MWKFRYSKREKYAKLYSILILHWKWRWRRSYITWNFELFNWKCRCLKPSPSPIPAWEEWSRDPALFPPATSYRGSFYSSVQKRCKIWKSKFLYFANQVFFLHCRDPGRKTLLERMWNKLSNVNQYFFVSFTLMNKKTVHTIMFQSCSTFAPLAW